MRRAAFAALAATALLLGARAQQDAEASCRVCHPGPTKALSTSPHGVLSLRAELHGRTCAACHGDLDRHARDAAVGLPTRVAAVDAATCAQCHPGRAFATELAAHPVTKVGTGAAPLPAPGRTLLQELAQTEQAATFDVSGFVELGYRFVHHAGSRDAFHTDLDLEPGVRLREAELRGTGGGAATVDTMLARVHDLGDPRWDARLLFDARERGRLDGRHHRDRFLYAASGDFHRVDRRSAVSTADAELGLGDGVALIASHEHRDEDGFWLTERIGERNVPVQTVVGGVESPRTLRGDDSELGLRWRGDWDVTIAGGYRTHRGVDRWSYSQPAAANPGFVASEDTRTASVWEGPSARATLGRDFGDLRVDASARHLEHDRRTRTAGTGSGYDTGPYTTTTNATGDGRARLWLADLDTVWTLSSQFDLQASLSWRDYAEDLFLRERVVTQPGAGPPVTVDTDVDDRTTQRLFDGELSGVYRPDDDVEFELGYGYAHEQLRLPDLQPADPLDFRRGTQRDAGVLAGLRWRFAESWTLRADGRDFASDGLDLHAITPSKARQAGAGLGWRDGDDHADVFVRYRRNDNDVSSHRLEAVSTGLTAGTTFGPVTATAGYTFARTEWATRTNFYFDPDPAPQQTLVGFVGETHTWTADLSTTLQEALQCEVGTAITRTIGSFDVQSLEVRADLRYRIDTHLWSGVEWRHLAYDDERGIDDWSTDLVFVYLRAAW